MKIFKNERTIQRNRRIGSYTMLAGMAVLIGGLVISINQISTGFQNPQAANPGSEAMFNYSTIAMFAGLILTEISMYFNNRWGRKPSMDDKLSLSLKGLDDRYTVYHYRGPVPAMLVGPSGIWVLVPMYQKGAISFENGRYRQAGVTWFVRTFYQEGIGRPEMLAQNQVEDVKRFIQKNLPEAVLPPVQAILVFTAADANVQVGEDAPYPALHADKLKDFVRRKAKEQPASVAALQPFIDALPTS
jgi:hypothetical protein